MRQKHIRRRSSMYDTSSTNYLLFSHHHLLISWILRALWKVLYLCLSSLMKTLLFHAKRQWILTISILITISSNYISSTEPFMMHCSLCMIIFHLLISLNRTLLHIIVCLHLWALMQISFRYRYHLWSSLFI